MIRHIIGILLIVSVATAQGASPYISLSGGASFLEVQDRKVHDSENSDDGYVGEAAVGVAFGDAGSNPSPLRAEVAYSYQEDRSDDIGNEDIKTSAIMLNGYLDLATDTAINPYFLLGIGRADIESGSYDSSQIAYQLGGGLGYSITDHVVLDLKYKYFTTEDESNRFRFNTHQVQLGVRYMF